MITIGDLIKEQMGKEEKPTAEGLRAAAKVLEEKAKELEKPKRTPYQEAILKYASEQELTPVAFKAGKQREVRDLSCGENAGEFYKFEDWETTKRLTTNMLPYWHENKLYHMSIVIYTNDYGDWSVAVEYPM